MGKHICQSIDSIAKEMFIVVNTLYAPIYDGPFIFLQKEPFYSISAGSLFISQRRLLFFSLLTLAFYYWRLFLVTVSTLLWSPQITSLPSRTANVEILYLTFTLSFYNFIV